MSRSTLVTLYALFCLSGGAALIYEVSWARQIGDLLGHSAPTAGVVLAAYFIGLAIGYEIGGRMVRRVRPLTGYAAAEVLAGLWALLLPLVLRQANHPAVIAWLGSNYTAGAALLQAGLCLVLLLPATVSLGVTLPCMAAALEPGGRETDWRRPILAYALNTLGAVAGVVFATAYLLAEVGVSAASYVGAGLSIGCALAALVVLRRVAAGAVPLTSADAATVSRAPIPFGGAECVAVVSGFAVLALEVLYLRLFSLILHNSSYSFAAVVAVFLLALAAGAALAGALILRMEPRGLASASLVFGGVATAVSLAAFVHWSGLSYFQSTGGLRSYLWGSALLAGGVMLPPITLLGMTLPAAWRDAARSMPAGTAGHAATIGRLSLINTLAAAGGSLAASFVLLPGIGLHRSFVCIVGLVGLTGMVRLAWSGRSRAAIAAGLITAATATQMFLTPLESQISLRSEDEVLVRRWETAYGWIDVVRDGRRGSLDIRQNLNYRYGSTGDDAQREMRQAHLPLLLHPQPHDVLFLGLGTGVTAAGALAHPEVQHVTVVELIPEVVAAARLLADGNQHVVDDPRVRVEVDDARHFLLASPQSYDVVVGDLFVPWESETGYLYTREHFERVRSRLRPGGVCCQWLALYQLGPHEFELIADTFASVFPETTLWWGYLNPRRPMVALVGSAGPLPWKPTAIDARCAHLSTDSRPVDDSLSTSDRLLDALIGTWPNRPGALLNTVDRPRVEFSTPWSQQSGRLLRNINLERYFVGVLRRLPPPLGEIRQAVDASKSERIRANQRYVLFGE